MTLPDTEELDGPLSVAINSLSVTEFATASQLILETLEASSNLEVIVHLSHVLLREAPEGALVVF
jgi:hypothetical protein